MKNVPLKEVNQTDKVSDNNLISNESKSEIKSQCNYDKLDDNHRDEEKNENGEYSNKDISTEDNKVKGVKIEFQKRVVANEKKPVFSIKIRKKDK